MKIDFLNDECWWGGIVEDGANMPYTAKTEYVIETTPDEIVCPDQSAPFFVSNKGRYIWSDEPFKITFDKGTILIEGEGEIILESGFETLKAAHAFAANHHFRPTGTIPDELFFSLPQYNTWIELMYNQNEVQILEYAKSIIESGLPAGILMIDEGWSEDYGVFDFYPGRFRNPKGMIKKLHDLGFVVMLWVTPQISPDSNTFRELRQTDYLIKDKNNEIAVRKWWNGFSCVLDLTNPKAEKWFLDKLNGCMEKYGIDGFKFDAGDAYFYKDTDKTYIRQMPKKHTRVYNQFGIQYRFNELRSVWNMGGQPLVCRLQDKMHSWDDHGLNQIIPNTIAQGICGFYYGCPDMIGGGCAGSFLESRIFDEELYIRWIEASALCPMMQFSIAPWRVLSGENYEIVKKFAALHAGFGEIILDLARHASETGEPIIRHMAYEFPNEGFEDVNSQFLLGDSILVAPVLQKGSRERIVKLPKGGWVDELGNEFEGGREITIPVPLDRLPYFKKLNN